MNDLITENNIKSMIYEIRGNKVMLDSDLAKLFKCENGTKSINLAFKRNIDKFPKGYFYQLSKEEYSFLRFQIETANAPGYGKTRVLPYVFTDKGILMLATILRTPIAIKVSIDIIETFVKMRSFIVNNEEVFRRLSVTENKIIEHDGRLNEIMDKLQNKEFKEKVFFDGEFYDAYSLIVDIIKSSKEEIIVIDNYIDKSILDLLVNKNKYVKIIIVSKNEEINNDIKKFNKQYSKIIYKYLKEDHDRFIIIDKNKLYHIGASLKDLGSKWFAISLIEDNIYLGIILSKIDSL